MNSDRERKPKPPPRPKGPGGRIETKFILVTRCNNCATEIQVMDQIQVTDKCKNCGTDLHTCRNCMNFDPAARSLATNFTVQPSRNQKPGDSFCLHVLVMKGA